MQDKHSSTTVSLIVSLKGIKVCSPDGKVSFIEILYLPQPISFINVSCRTIASSRFAEVSLCYKSKSIEGEFVQYEGIVKGVQPEFSLVIGSVNETNVLHHFPVQRALSFWLIMFYSRISFFWFSIGFRFIVHESPLSLWFTYYYRYLHEVWCMKVIKKFCVYFLIK